jgi:hypothetical protein
MTSVFVLYDHLTWTFEKDEVLSSLYVCYLFAKCPHFNLFSEASGPKWNRTRCPYFDLLTLTLIVDILFVHLHFRQQVLHNNYFDVILSINVKSYLLKYLPDICHLSNFRYSMSFFRNDPFVGGSTVFLILKISQSVYLLPGDMIQMISY